VTDGSIFNEDGIILFTCGNMAAPSGPRSALTMWLMDYLGVTFRIVDVSTDEAARIVAERRSGMRLFPQIYVDGEFIGSGEVVAELGGGRFFTAATVAAGPTGGHDR
jgi:monothiol glutaredoxin